MKQFSKAFLRWLSAPITVFLIILMIIFTLGSRFFFSFGNFQNIFIQASTIGILALGLTFVMVNGNIDLSVGSLLGLASAVFVRVYNQVSLPAAVFAALLSGVLLGLIHGFAVCRLKVNSFITTLASMIGVKGLLFAYTQENSLTLNDFSFTELSSKMWLSFPLFGWIYVGIALLFYFLQQRTVHGRNLYYVGGNMNAARSAGIATSQHQIINFVICSTMAALGGVMLSSQLGASTPNTGRGYELWAITAVALGGIRLRGGVGSVMMVLMGGIVLGVLRNGMNFLHVNAAYTYIIVGLVLLVVLIIDKYLGVFSHLKDYLKLSVGRAQEKEEAKL